jgi:hypothetical protein
MSNIVTKLGRLSVFVFVSSLGALAAGEPSPTWKAGVARVDTTPNISGKPLAIVFGYACHNTTLRPDMMKIAADFAGYAQDRIETDNPGATALFVTGCAGDADPHPFGTLEMAKEHGEELGEAVKLVLDHSTWMSSLAGSLCAAFTETTIHFSGRTDRASCERLLEAIVVNAARDVVKKVRQK